VRMAKEGSVIAGLMDSFATSISLALQHGVPLHLLIEKFKGTRFEPSGFTGNQEIPIATSIMDYLFRWLALRFPQPGADGIVERHPAARGAQLDLPKIPVIASDAFPVAGSSEPARGGAAGDAGASSRNGHGNGHGDASAAASQAPIVIVEQSARSWVQETDAPPCHECGTLMVRNGACHKCPNCGSTSGCS